jgi:hypothetical protein
LMYSGHRMQFLQGRHCGGRQLDEGDGDRSIKVANAITATIATE